MILNNKPPTANAGDDKAVKEGDTVILDGSKSSDTDDGIVSYEWRQTSGPAVTLSDANSGNPSFTAPAVDNLTTLIFQVTVTDKGGLTASDSCIVIVEKLVPNLSVSELKIPTSAASLSQAEISWQVKNTNNANISGSWTDKLYLSSDNLLNDKDTLLAEYTRTEGLSGNSDYWQSKTVNFPDLSIGSYYIIVKTNANNGITESDSADNLISKPFTIAIAKLMTATPDRIPVNLNPGVPATGQITIGNLGTVNLSGIAAKVQDNSANITVQLDVPSDLASMASKTVNYTVTASNESVLENKPTVTFSSNEGATADIAFEITVIPAKPQLLANPGYLETGMLRGTQRTIECEISNTGGIPANNLLVLVPDADWLKLVTPQSIATLAPGEKVKIGFSLTPAQDMQLGPYTGNIVLSGANANLNIGFRFTAVSEAKGGLKIIAKDEFSYFAADHPNVKGAKVSVKDAYEDKVIAEGVTDDAGVFTAQNINEGVYNLEVSADKHGTYRSAIMIVPAVEKEITAFLPRQLVTYRWSVVPIQLTDEYKVTLEAVFETHVPAPVVTVEPIYSLLPIPKGETMTFNLTITNHGLIAANEVEINFPENDGYYIEPTIPEIGTLAAMTSIVVPVKVRAKLDGPIGSTKRGYQTVRSEKDDSTNPLCLEADVFYLYICDLYGNRHKVPIKLQVIRVISGAINCIFDPMACVSLACEIVKDPCICSIGSMSQFWCCGSLGIPDTHSGIGGGGGGGVGHIRRIVTTDIDCIKFIK